MDQRRLDTIELRKERAVDPPLGGDDWDVGIYINGEELIETVGGRDAHRGLPPHVAFLPSRHLLGEDNWFSYGEGRIAVLRCTCGCEGCGDFAIDIEVTPERVIWSTIPDTFGLQPRRWEFDRAEYESALMPREGSGS